MTSDCWSYRSPVLFFGQHNYSFLSSLPYLRRYFRYRGTFSKPHGLAFERPFTAIGVDGRTEGEPEGRNRNAVRIIGRTGLRARRDFWTDYVSVAVFIEGTEHTKCTINSVQSMTHRDRTRVGFVVHKTGMTSSAAQSRILRSLQ